MMRLVRVNYSVFLLSAIVALAALFRFYQLGAESLWIDEIGHIQVASYQSISQLLSGVRQHRGAVPFDYLVLQQYLNIFSPEGEYQLRIPYAIYGVLAVFCLFFFARGQGGDLAGLLSAFLLVISPFQTLILRNQNGFLFVSATRRRFYS